MSSQLLQEAAALLSQARAVTVLTGAGISKESGIETFRDKKDGLWSRYDPMTLASPESFAENPELVWKWYCHRRDQVNQTGPNEGHKVIAKWESRYKDFLLVTQNVDGLHEKAGTQKIVKLHGTLWEARCTKTGKVLSFVEEPETIPPYCKCGSLLRPNIVWFGEALPSGAIEQSVEHVLKSDVLVVVGTSLVVYPAASLVPYALQAGIPVIEVNPEQSEYSELCISLRGKSGEVLPELDKLL
jgi:NAD-dependent deacetylase